MFEDPWNPTSSEIKRWAYDAKAPFPDQDWLLSLEDVELAEEYMHFATDQSCPKQSVFLDALYLLVGDAVRGWQGGGSRPRLERLFALAATTGNADLLRWRDESEALLSNPTSFDHEYWCGSRF